MATLTVASVKTGTNPKLITGKAYKDAAKTVAYNLDTEVTKIEFKMKKPRNRGNIGPFVATVTNPGTGGNDFQYSDSSNDINIEGYWGFEGTLTLTNGDILPTEIAYCYIAASIEIETSASAVVAPTVPLNGLVWYGHLDENPDTDTGFFTVNDRSNAPVKSDGRHLGRLQNIFSSVDIQTTHQGYAFDGTYHYCFHTDRIDKRNNDATWSLVTQNTSPFGSSSAVHLGDGAYYNGKLYVPAKDRVTPCVGTRDQHIIVYDATSAGMPILEEVDISAQSFAPDGICIEPTDGTNGIIYISSFCGSGIWKYDLSDYTYLGKITLSPALPEGPVTGPQGITKMGGMFYITHSNNILYEADPVTGTVRELHVFTEPGIIEGIDNVNSQLRILIDNAPTDSKVHYFDIENILHDDGLNKSSLFDGDDQKIEVQSTSSLSNLSKFTVWGWVWKDGTWNANNQDYLWSKEPVSFSGSLDRLVWLYNVGVDTNQIRGQVDRSSALTRYASATDTLKDFEWNFIVVDFDDDRGDGERFNIYHGTALVEPSEVTYSLQTEGSGTINDDGTGPSMMFGREQDNTRNYKGRSRHTGIHNRVITAQERLDIWNATKPAS